MTAVRVGLVAAGLAALGYGAVRLVADVDPLWYLVFAVAVLLGHDLVVAPAVLVTGRLLRGLGRIWTGALVVTAILVLYALPYLLGFGRRATNPSALPLDYPVGLAGTVAVVWAVAALLALTQHLPPRHRSRTTAPSPPSPPHTPDASPSTPHTRPSTPDALDEPPSTPGTTDPPPSTPDTADPPPSTSDTADPQRPVSSTDEPPRSAR